MLKNKGKENRSEGKRDVGGVKRLNAEGITSFILSVVV